MNGSNELPGRLSYLLTYSYWGWAIVDIITRVAMVTVEFPII